MSDQDDPIDADVERAPAAGRRGPASRPITARRVTMKDVAKRAGVSQPTVSFVLNDRRDVSVAEETRERVREAARDLNFQPNRAAQSLRSNTSYLIGILADEIVSRAYAGRIALGIQQAVQPAGYVSFVVETSESPEATEGAVENLVNQGVAGLIYASAGASPVRYPVPKTEVPTVFVNCWDDAVSDATIVLADEYQGGRDAAAATFAAGHRDVVFLGGPADDYARKQRERGLMDAAVEAGVPPERIRRESGDYSVRSGYDLAMRVLPDPAVTALICGNDRMAVGALMALHSSGLDCPGDVSIVGFDDQPDLAEDLHPALTTVALPHLKMGLDAGKLLLDEEAAPGLRLIPCTFVARGTLTGPRSA
ncbi:LacI family DNA-binding transcriptional regulator [Humibacter sp. RRB41]|uniref:LacI family DNA-binding transcriptional regulator n=1 Tax=Humibacter sp. RRB41 TaxID=2919946 RepID=UPI001FAA207A|nr:LacI family DNA-binding transcriptional regulator [Humibacter sp. RRB41]